MTVSRRRLVQGLGAGVLGAAALGACTPVRGRGRGRRRATTTAPTGEALGEPDTPLRIASIGASHGRSAGWEHTVSIAVEEALIDVNARWQGLFGQEVGHEDRHVQEKADEDLTDVVAAWHEAGVSVVVSSLDEDSLAAALPLFVEAGMAVIDVVTSGMSVRQDSVQDSGLLFRLAPNTRTLASVYAEEAWSDSGDRGGTPGTVAVVSEDTAQGRSLVHELSQILEPKSGKVVLESYHPLGKTGDVKKTVSAIVDKKPALLVLHGGPESGQLLSALHEATSDENGRSQLQLTARLSPAATVDQSGAELVAESMARATGLEPGGDLTDEHVNMMLNRDPDLHKTGYAFSQQAYDAVVIACLAAYQGLSVEGTAIAGQIPAVLTGTEQCTDYDACRRVLRDALQAGDTATVGYEGRSGALELGGDRDVRTGQMRTYSFAEDNSLEQSGTTGFEDPA